MRQGDQSDPDRNFMAVALDMARLGLGRTSPNPMVGAVIVKDGKILATGFHRKAGLPHAEIEAMNRVRAIGRSPRRGTTLYVTLEPCCHHGRTPPCTDAILRSGIARVVVGMRDPDPKVAGRGIRLLKRAGLDVRVGVLQKECRALNEAYIKHRTKKSPFVILKMAITLDGKVGHRDAPRGRPYKITNAEADRQTHALRDLVDAILVGAGTVLSDDPRLTTRLTGKKGKNPIRVVLDSRLRIPTKARILSRGVATWIATTVSPRHPKVSRLKKRGVKFLFFSRDRSGRVPLARLLKELASRNILSLLVEGGPRVWGSFLRQKLADHLVLFMSYELLGDRGVPALEQSMMKRLSLTSPVCRLVGEDLMVEGRPAF